MQDRLVFVVKFAVLFVLMFFLLGTALPMIGISTTLGALSAFLVAVLWGLWELRKCRSRDDNGDQG